jgi:hypothetical protein
MHSLLILKSRLFDQVESSMGQTILGFVSRREKLDALTLVAKGHTIAHVACLTHMSVSTIVRAKRKQRLWGDIEGGRKKMGRRPIFTSEIINVSTPFGCCRLRNIPVCFAIDHGSTRLLFKRVSK